MLPLGMLPSYGNEGLLNRLGSGASERNMPGLSMRAVGRSRIPSKICPTCGGTGRVPDMAAIQGMMGMGGGRIGQGARG